MNYAVTLKYSGNAVEKLHFATLPEARECASENSDRFLWITDENGDEVYMSVKECNICMPMITFSFFEIRDKEEKDADSK